MRTRDTYLAVVLASVGSAACTAILGSFEVSTAPPVVPDAGGQDSATENDAGSDAPSTSSFLSNVTAITAGARHTCALLGGDKRVYCWGELGPTSGPVPTPKVVVGLPTAKAVEAGPFHTCALSETGKAYCWGANDCGKLGRGAFVPPFSATPEPISAPAASQELVPASLTLGADHTCAVDPGGAIYCWGCNTKAQLGQDPVATMQSAVPLLSVSGDKQSQTAGAGVTHNCAIFNNLAGVRGVGCWGTEDVGQLGDTLPETSMSQVVVTANIVGAGANGVTAIASGAAHTCALDSDKALFCWGANAFGQAGVSPTVSVHPAAPVRAYGGVDRVAAGGATTCVVRDTTEVHCNGANEAGQLGRGSADSDPHPAPAAVRAVGGTGPLIGTAVAVGRSHACAILTDRTVACWGLNEHGELGEGVTSAPRTVPVRVVKPAE